jgi:hypothetical protein
MDKETNGHLYIANDNLKRIADALDTIIKMVKEDQERSKKYMEKSKDPFIKTMEEGESE